MRVSEAVADRRSVRAFLDTPVDPALLARLIEQAARAPSGGNLQPWHVHVVTGEAIARLKALMATRVAEAPLGEGTEYNIYPRVMTEPFAHRRRASGGAYYDVLGIARDDWPRRQAVFADNFRFFGAPAGLFCTVDRGHGPPQWADCGMFLQTLMLLLREAGLSSCAQEAWAMYHRTVGEFLGVPAGQMLFTGMAIGFADPDAAVNAFPIERAGLAEWAVFHA